MSSEFAARTFEFLKGTKAAYLELFQTLRKVPLEVRLFLLGGLSFLGFAPFYQAYLPVLGLFVLACSLEHQSRLKVFLRVFLFAAGQSIIGIYWIYYSAYHFAGVPLLASLLIPILTGLAQALYPAVLFLFYSQRLPALLRALQFGALWVLSEWLRTLNWTGMPWLFLGSAHTQDFLTPWLPTLGAFGLGFILAVVAALLSLRRFQGVALAALLVLLLGFGSRFLPSWVRPGPTLKVLALQFNNPIETRGSLETQDRLLSAYARRVSRLSEPVDLLLLTETSLSSITTPAQIKRINKIFQSQPNLKAWAIGLLESDNPRRTRRNPNIISMNERFYNFLYFLKRRDDNAVEALRYYKSRMVPFGEYTPGWILRLGWGLGFPLSQMMPKTTPVRDFPLKDDTAAILPLLCYEEGYSALLRKNLLKTSLPSAVVLTGDDTWFGNTLGPMQNLQLAQVRAEESGRFVLRLSHSGPSALITPEGQFIEPMRRFTQDEHEYYVPTRTGNTPYMLAAPFYVLLLWAFVIWLFIWEHKPIESLIRRKNKKREAQIRKNLGL